LPSVITVGLALLVIGIVAIDRVLWQNDTLEIRSGLFLGGVDGARGVFTAIAGSLIAAAATVFSITVVVLQLASSQFSPRVLRNFTSDRHFQAALGLLLGTFVYSLLALWSVGRQREEIEPFIPTLAVAVGILLALISVAALILFIQRVASLIQVSELVDRLVDEAIRQVKRVYGDGPFDSPAELPAIDLPASVSVPSAGAGYIRGIDYDALLAHADERSCTIAVTRQIGDFVLPEQEIAQVRPVTEAGDDFICSIQRAFVQGPYRLLDNDVSFGLQRIADLGIKSLSPGINDPTTAINCIDRLCEVLYQIAIRDSPSTIRHGKKGGVLLRVNPSFPDMVHLAFAQIRVYGAGDVAVSSHLATNLGELASAVPPGLQTPLVEETALIAVSCEAAGMIPADLQRVAHSASWTGLLGTPESGGS